MAKILVVDDELDLCEILQFNLQTEGYNVDTSQSAEEALTRNLSEYNLILLDVMMDGISGFRMAQIIRNRADTTHIPIIFITALADEDNMVNGLELGGDDYITKPLSLREVKSRVKAVLRRAQEKMEGENTIIAFDSLIIDNNRRDARIDNIELPLTRLEFELLKLLLSNKNRCLTREHLIQHAWPPNTLVSERTVDVAITRLRKKIGRFGNYIKTRAGYGYIFET